MREWGCLIGDSSFFFIAQKNLIKIEQFSNIYLTHCAQSVKIILTIRNNPYKNMGDILEKGDEIMANDDWDIIALKKLVKESEAKDQRIMELEEQLAEKTLTIEQINKAFIENRSLWKGKYEQSNQDKISFTIEQLEKLKRKIQHNILFVKGDDYLNVVEEIDNQIDDQINELMEMK